MTQPTDGERCILAFMQGNPAALRDLQWDDVRLFLSLCRSRTVAQAGQKLGVDASTVSRRLGALEGALGTSLFARGRDGCTPTEAAEHLLPVAEEIERGMARFANQVSTLETEASGLVRLTCPPDVAEVVVVPLLEELLRQSPGLRVSLVPGESVLDLTRREADIALRTVRPQSGDLVMTRLTSARWVLAGTPALVKKLGTLRDFAVAPWLGWGEAFAHLHVARWFTKHVRGAEPLVRSDSLRLLLAAARAGIGVTLAPEPSLKHFGLAPVRLAKPLRAAASEWPTDELYLVTHRALRDVPRVRVVWELLLERWGRR
jgi:DNA-binding transcriptional LysR family regulator